MVADELKERNRPDIASSYSGEQPENTWQGRYELMKENQPLHDADAANQSKLLFDSSTNMAKSTSILNETLRKHKSHQILKIH